MSGHRYPAARRYKADLDARTLRCTHSVCSTLDLAQDMSFRLPAWQREYVWGADNALSLMDSVMHGYPIGSLFFYSPADSGHLGRGSLIIDGQQRLTTLRCALIGGVAHSVEGTHDIGYDMETGKLQIGSSGRHVLSLADLLDREAQDERVFVAGLRGDVDACTRHLRSAIAARAIERHRTPYTLLYGCSAEQAIEAFRRINTSGIALTEAQVDRLTSAASP